MFHDVVNCAAVHEWRNQPAGTPLSRELLRGVFVPEDSCIVEKVDLATTNAYKIAGRMCYKHHPHYGAFVVRHKTQLPSQPKTTLRELTIRVFDQKLKKRRLGVYHLTNVARLADSEFTADTEFTEEWEGSTLCGDFVNMCQSRDKKLLKKLDQTNDSFWSRALDQAALCTEPKYRPSYAVDVEASLFTPDSKNPW